MNTNVNFYNTSAMIFFLAVVSGIAIAYFPLAIALLAIGFVALCLIPIQTPIIPLLTMLVLSPLRTLISTESPLALPFDIGQIMLVIYLGGWLVYRVQSRKQILTVAPSIVLGAILGIVLVFGINIWSSMNTSAWLTEWLKWVVIAILVWLISLSGDNNWRWLIFALLASALANAIVGLYIFFGGSGADHLVVGGRFFRAFGTFGQPNPFGGFMGIALPLSMMGIYSQAVPIIKAIWLNRRVSLQNIILIIPFVITTLVLFAALIASWSRGAWIGFIISTGVMIFAIPRKLYQSLIFALMLGGIILVLWFAGFIPQSIVERLTTAATDFITIEDIRGVDITTVNYAVVERIAHWQAAIHMAEAYPILGVGLGNYEIVYNDFRLLNWKEPLGHAHNYYLNILAETGIIGLLAYMIFWVIIITITWQTRNHPDLFTRCVTIGLLGAWTYISVHSVFDNLYVNNLFLHIGLLLSILAILNQQIRQMVTLE